MARISWSADGSRFFEVGVDRGVLYVDSNPGVPWTGLISVDESIDGGEATPYYIDGIKYLNLASTEEFNATVKAFAYPIEFAQCDGSAQVRPGLFFTQQQRKKFGLSYRTLVGNDTHGVDHGYKIHLVYNALAAPPSRTYNTFSDQINASDFSWTLSTQNRVVAGYGTTAHIVIDSRYTERYIMDAIEAILYGDETNVPRLLTPEELVAIFDTPLDFTVIDNGDGTYTIAGPDESVMDIGDGMFLITNSTVVQTVEGTYTISS